MYQIVFTDHVTGEKHFSIDEYPTLESAWKAAREAARTERWRRFGRAVQTDSGFMVGELEIKIINTKVYFSALNVIL